MDHTTAQTEYDVPVTVRVTADSEARARQQVSDLLEAADGSGYALDANVTRFRVSGDPVVVQPIRTVTVKLNSTNPRAAAAVAELLELYGQSYVPGYTGVAEITETVN